MTSEVKVKKMKKMLALISRTNDIICMLDVTMMVAKLRAMLKLFETDTQTDRHTYSKTPNPISGKYF